MDFLLTFFQTYMATRCTPGTWIRKDKDDIDNAVDILRRRQIVRGVGAWQRVGQSVPRGSPAGRLAQYDLHLQVKFCGAWRDVKIRHHRLHEHSGQGKVGCESKRGAGSREAAAHLQTELYAVFEAEWRRTETETFTYEEVTGEETIERSGAARAAGSEARTWGGSRARSTVRVVTVQRHVDEDGVADRAGPADSAAHEGHSGQQQQREAGGRCVIV